MQFRPGFFMNSIRHVDLVVRAGLSAGGLKYSRNCVELQSKL